MPAVTSSRPSDLHDLSVAALLLSLGVGFETGDAARIRAAQAELQRRGIEVLLYLDRSPPPAPARSA